jgi:radical SAM superfamily enzyme YgiQ (UPF0313 family)
MSKNALSVAFVNPSVGYSDRRKSKPIGLAYIGAYVRQHGYYAAGFDFGDSLHRPVDLSAKHELDRFDVVGFSVYNESLSATIEHAQWIKARRPDAKIVLGGPHATAVHQQIVERYPVVDAVVRREGELTMLSLLDSFGSEAWRDVPGTTTRDIDGQPQVNPDAPFLDDLDTLPFPDFDFISASGYPPLTYFDSIVGVQVPALAVNSSRSCPYNCSFCGVLTIGRKYRMRTGGSVVAELDHFRQRDDLAYRHVYFSDANFFVYPRRAVEIVRALHQYDGTLTFSFGTRVNQLLKHADYLGDLKSLGLRFVELGIESASAPVLQRLAKGILPAQNLEAVRLLSANGLELSLDFIMIDPETTLDDLRANLVFLKTAGLFDYVPHDHLYTKLVLYAGTPIREYYEKRIGVTFDIDELPSLESLIENEDVGAVHAGTRWFRTTYQEAIDLVLGAGEAVLQHRVKHRAQNPVNDVERQLQLAVVALRHAPNLFFENMIRHAEDFGAEATEAVFASCVPAIGVDIVPVADVLLKAAVLIDTLTSGERDVLGRLTGHFRQSGIAEVARASWSAALAG